MYRIVKSCYFDMAHRIRGHKGKCRFLHGHSWKVELCLEAEELFENMVVDFAEIKEFFTRLTNHFDHKFLLGKTDREELEKLLTRAPSSGISQELVALSGALGMNPNPASLATLGIETIQIDPTAETLAKYFWENAVGCFARFAPRVRVAYVRVYEQLHPTESYAEYSE